jgi:hypothetical protein
MCAYLAVLITVRGLIVPREAGHTESDSVELESIVVDLLLNGDVKGAGKEVVENQSAKGQGRNRETRRMSEL